MSLLFDIIIPAYNCTKTIGRTLDSLLKQTSKDFGVIVVDDASTDDLPTVLNRYTGQLSIKYIKNQQNLGCGMTRKVGLDASEADYIAFLDSDDILLDTAVADWRSVIEEHGCDALVSPIIYAEPNKTTIRNYAFSLCHGKVYKTEFLRRYDIGADERVKCYDDMFFNHQVFDLAKNICILRKPNYVQIKTENSVTQTVDFKKNVQNDYEVTKALSVEKLSKLVARPLKNYSHVENAYNNMLWEEKENHKVIIEELKNVIIQDE